ncbi:helix-turn-helix transcriptional regulator [Nodularia sp. UHCC 0506]|uniref:helix-turn-helix domain-containing protein n=1 Tax=Nodularia sp. UHCC 0506 TaxID=3110243 RepID=UPI002B1FD89E|nr:helix-turn-helix transcriptional regulator [Nodularia sp. UHCC 0506]MEA5512674.1 helix-turn-helix transcriptional regulator [Nodularia sp. UHCC 0506]
MTVISPATSFLPYKDLSFGKLLKYWRNQRGFSQLNLALASDVSQRHISFLESSRANPSREMVLHLATVLNVSLRDQNVMLTAAGFDPIYCESDLLSPELEPIRQAIGFILKQQEPFPALVMDRYWNLIENNTSSQRLITWLINPEKLQQNFYIDGKINLMRLTLHPQGLKPFIANWEEIASHLMQRIYREAITAGESNQYMTLFNEIQTYPDVIQIWQKPHPYPWQIPLLTMQFIKDELSFSFFTTITTLGTPHDILLQELRIESLFPADKMTEVNLKKLEIASKL